MPLKMNWFWKKQKTHHTTVEVQTNQHIRTRQIEANALNIPVEIHRGGKNKKATEHEKA